MKTKTWVWLLVVALALAYVYQYYRYPATTGMLQTDVEGFTWEMLFSRQPVFIHTAVADPGMLTKLWFGKTLGYLSADASGEWVQNRFKYKLVYNAGEGEGELLLAPPGEVPSPDTEGVIALKVPAKMAVILPFHWFSATTDAVFLEYGYNDWVTWLLPA